MNHELCMHILNQMHNKNYTEASPQPRGNCNSRTKSYPNGFLGNLNSSRSQTLLFLLIDLNDVGLETNKKDLQSQKTNGKLSDTSKDSLSSLNLRWQKRPERLTRIRVTVT